MERGGKKFSTHTLNLIQKQQKIGMNKMNKNSKTKDLNSILI